MKETINNNNNPVSNFKPEKIAALGLAATIAVSGAACGRDTNPTENPTTESISVTSEATTPTTVETTSSIINEPFLLDTTYPVLSQAEVSSRETNYTVDKTIVNEDGQIMVPAQFVCIALGCKYSVDDVAGTITIKDGEHIFTLNNDVSGDEISSKTTIDGQESTFDTAAKNIENRAYLPLEMISVATGTLTDVYADGTVNIIEPESDGKAIVFVPNSRQVRAIDNSLESRYRRRMSELSHNLEGRTNAENVANNTGVIKSNIIIVDKNTGAQINFSYTPGGSPVTLEARQQYYNDRYSSLKLTKSTCAHLFKDKLICFTGFDKKTVDIYVPNSDQKQTITSNSPMVINYDMDSKGIAVPFLETSAGQKYNFSTNQWEGTQTTQESTTTTTTQATSKETTKPITTPTTKETTASVPTTQSTTKETSPTPTTTEAPTPVEKGSISAAMPYIAAGEFINPAEIGNYVETGKNGAVRIYAGAAPTDGERALFQKFESVGTSKAEFSDGSNIIGINAENQNARFNDITIKDTNQDSSISVLNACYKYDIKSQKLVFFTKSTGRVLRECVGGKMVTLDNFRTLYTTAQYQQKTEQMLAANYAGKYSSIVWSHGIAILIGGSTGMSSDQANITMGAIDRLSQIDSSFVSYMREKCGLQMINIGSQGAAIFERREEIGKISINSTIFSADSLQSQIIAILTVEPRGMEDEDYKNLGGGTFNRNGKVLATNSTLIEKQAYAIKKTEAWAGIPGEICASLDGITKIDMASYIQPVRDRNNYGVLSMNEFMVEMNTNMNGYNYYVSHQ